MPFPRAKPAEIATATVIQRLYCVILD